MVDMNSLNLKATKLDFILRFYYIKLRFFKNFMLRKLALNKSNRKLCSVNGKICFFQKIGQSAYMVLVTVSYKYTSYFINVLFNICEIGNNKVNAQHIGVGESKAAVHQNHIVAALIKSHILTDFV